MDSLRRWWEPVTVVVLVAAGLNALAVVASLFPLAAAGRGVIRSTALTFANQAAYAPGLLALAVLVGACALAARTPHARGLAVAGALVAGVSVLVALVLVVVALSGAGLRPLAALNLLLPLVPPALAVVFLGRLAALPRSQPAPVGVAVPGSAAAPALPAAPVPPTPEQQPTWEPDVAAGAAWSTAGEAATGAPAAGWGQASGGGWQPSPWAPAPSSASSSTPSSTPPGPAGPDVPRS